MLVGMCCANWQTACVFMTTHFPWHLYWTTFSGRPEGDLWCSSCGRPSPGKTFAPSNSLLMKLLLGWLFDLPNFPDGLFFVEVKEADIDYQEYSLTLNTLNTHYGRLCSACLSQSEHPILNKSYEEEKSGPLEDEAICTGEMTPSKSTSQLHGQEVALTSTPSKHVLQGIAVVRI